MGDATTIEWCDYTFNPWEGCAKVSPGCAHCYAETRNHRFGNDNWGKGKPRRLTSDANWRQPLKWSRGPFVCDQCGKVFKQITGRQKLSEPIPGDACHHCNFGHYRRPRVFCASLADWLDDEVPIEWLARLLKLIHDTPNLDWLLLTKRPENFFPRVDYILNHLGSEVEDWIEAWIEQKPPSNVWLGTSVEDQKRADERIPELLKIPAKVRFLSVELAAENERLKAKLAEYEAFIQRQAQRGRAA